MSRKLGDRCKGHCCKDIGLRVSPEVLKQSYYNWLHRDRHKKGSSLLMNEDSNEFGKGLSWYIDICLVYPMLVFQKEDNTHPDGGNGQLETIYHYTCKHYDDKKKICTIYEFRPGMCRTHGLEGCGYKNCCWKKAVEIRKEKLKKQKQQKQLEKKEKLELKACDSKKKSFV